jgi:hypothetical protein
MMKLFLVLVLTGITGAWSVSHAQAQDPKKIGAHGKWAAYTFQDGSGTVCYMASAPDKQKGKYVKRGDVYALVTNRPSAKTKGEVNFIAGYTFKKDSAVRVKVGSRNFKLFTTDDRAWSEDPSADSKLVKAMIRGSKMVVSGISGRGTKTTDTYSLSGFTATKKLIDRACKT